MEVSSFVILHFGTKNISPLLRGIRCTQVPLMEVSLYELVAQLTR